MLVHSFPRTLDDANYQVHSCDAAKQAKAAGQRKHAGEAPAEEDNKDEDRKHQEKEEFFDFISAPKEEETRKIIERRALVLAHILRKLRNFID